MVVGWWIGRQVVRRRDGRKVKKLSIDFQQWLLLFRDFNRGFFFVFICRIKKDFLSFNEDVALYILWWIPCTSNFLGYMNYKMIYENVWSTFLRKGMSLLSQFCEMKLFILIPHLLKKFVCFNFSIFATNLLAKNKSKISHGNKKKKKRNKPLEFIFEWVRQHKNHRKILIEYLM